MSPADDARRFAPAAERNQGPILEVLRAWLPAEGEVLELASGTGQHAAAFAAALPGIRWRPSEADPEQLPSIHAHRAAGGAPGPLEPLLLDARDDPWPVEPLDAILAVNMVHITPWEVTLGALAGAGRHLVEGGLLLLYGPYLVDGAPTTASNAAFDARLRAQDPAWGLRDVAALEEAAAPHGLELRERRAMPANNFFLCLERRPR